MRTKWLAAASTISLLAGAAPAWAASDSAVSEVVVTARRLDQARESIQPNLGATSYTLPAAFVDNLPGGENTGLNQVLLQAPGVSQDSFGQLHVRGDHANLQYRLNGVILPEGLAAFGQVLTPRLADRTELITGALPAQYGLRTAGVVNITTKSGAYQNGGEASVYGGAHGEYQPSLEYGASIGGTNVFGSLSYRRSQLGIESPDGSPTPDHDRTDQAQGFIYLDHALDGSDRVALILGASNQRFQIPNPRGLQPDLGLTVNGATSYPSTALDSTQREGTTFAIASFLHAADRWNVQASLSARYSTLTYRPSGDGELLYNGVSQYAAKRDTAVGFQVDGVYNLTPSHTLRAGGLLQADRAASSTLSSVLPVDDDGEQIDDRPLSIADKSGRTAWTGSLYLQDEWRPLTGVTVNYGLRYDRVTLPREEQQLSPRLNVVWEPAEGTTLHAGYARYFTPAPFGLVANATIAKFAGTTAAAISDLNDAPYAERTNYFDIGAHQHMGPVTLGIDLYEKRIERLLDEGQFGAPIILTPFNYANGRVHGIELTAAYAKGPFSAYANFAASKAQGRNIISSQFNFDPADLAYIAGHYIYLDHDQTYTASAGVSYLWRGFRVGGDLLYGSGLRADGDVPNGRALADYLQINLALSKSFEAPGGPLQIRLDVINLFDARYEIRDGSGVGVGAPQYGPRRGLFAGVSKAF